MKRFKPWIILSFLLVLVVIETPLTPKVIADEGGGYCVMTLKDFELKSTDCGGCSSIWNVNVCEYKKDYMQTCRSTNCSFCGWTKNCMDFEIPDEEK